jgi:predicted metalloprotease with PDZ domain
LIDDFADPEYAVREAASAAMRELMREPADARRAMPLLAAHHGSSRDAEVRARIGEVADRYFNQHVLPNYYQQPSFLGISASQTDLPDGQRAISVERVIEDTGAERGGLQTGDFIVGLDGKRFNAGYTVTDFTNDMRQRGVGTKLTFTIVRPPDFETTRDHKITMGAIPDEFLSEADLATRATQTEGLHERWWNQAFLQGRVTLPEDAPTTTAAPNEE